MQATATMTSNGDDVGKNAVKSTSGGPKIDLHTHILPEHIPEFKEVSQPYAA